jgi:hypothetical protein
MNHQPHITSVDNLKHMWESCKHHWQETWVDYKNLFEGKTCVDIGIWKGLLNAKAEKQLNCKTKIGVEPDSTHRADCKKINPHIELYSSIKDLPENIDTDILILHGVIYQMATQWIQEMETLLSRVDCKHIHIRNITNNESYEGENIKNIDGRELSKYNIDTFPTVNDIVEFLNKKNYSLIDRKDTNTNCTIMTFKKKYETN